MEKNELAEKVFEKMMSIDYCSQWMGIQAVNVSEGACVMKMIVKREMLNGYGVLHGGIAYAFADSAFAFASNSYGRIALSIQGSMTYARSAALGDSLLAVAKALSVTYKTAEFEVDILNEESREVYYRFRGIVYRKREEVLSEKP